MTKSQVFLYFCLSFIAGISLSSFFEISQPVLLAFLILGAVLFSLLSLNKKLAVLGICLILVSIGIWRHQTFELKSAQSELRSYNDKPEIITLIGRVVAEPDIRETNIKLIIEVQQIENGSRFIKEKVLVTTNRYPEYQYGDKLKIKGKLKTPPVFEDFNYPDYLAKSGIYSVIFWPKIEPLSSRNYRGPTSVIYAKILSFKSRLREVIDQNLSPPQSSILAALLLGDQRRMSQELKEKLNITGLRHITAISGLHITILSLILLEIFLGFGLWRKQALYLSLIFLILFVVMVGAPPSAVRAGIMASFLIISQSLGRLSQSARTIIFAGAVILALNPLLLKSDVGFQLSFLATLGIIYLTPLLQEWFKKLPDDFFGFLRLRSILSMTLSAQIFTLPLLIYNFGYFSLVSLLTNVLILPLLPLLMLIGIIFVLIGTISLFFGWLFSFLCWLFLSYIIIIINFFSKSPWSAIFLTISWHWLLISYLILGYPIWYLNKRRRLKFLEY